MIKSTPPLGPWDWVVPEEGEWVSWNLDGAEVAIQAEGNRWHWWSKSRKPHEVRRDFGGPRRGSVSPCGRMHTTIARREPVALRPMIMARPFVVRVTEPVPIHRGEEVRFPVDLPVSYHWVNQDGETLAHPQTIELPRTWFGDPSSGMGCFLWEVDLEDPAQGPFGSLVRCEVVLRNLSKAALVLQHFAIHTERLGLWLRDGLLVTDIVVVEGLADGALRMTTVNNPESRAGQNLEEAPKGPTEWMVQRGVSFLKTIAGIT